MLMGFVAEMPIEFKLIGGINIVYVAVSVVSIIQQDILQWGEFALAGAQVLAAIAVYYVYRQQKDIMYLDFTPDVRVLQYGVREDCWHPLYFELTNIGKGRASDISIQLEPTPIESTKFSFESDSVAAEKMQDRGTEGKYSGIGDYLIPTETAEFKSLIPQVVWYGSGGSEGRFDLGTVSDTLQENNIVLY